jgi:beta-carotene 3-hydroxylase
VNPAGFVAIALVAFVVTEAFAALAHRAVMHGRGWGWHSSHHQPRRGRVERNDLDPVVFAAITIAALAIGVNVDGLAWLVPIGVGVTAYGAAYLLVHDVMVHERAGAHPRLQRAGHYWLHAHHVHHRTGGAPYGFLLPIVPKERQRAK